MAEKVSPKKRRSWVIYAIVAVVAAIVWLRIFFTTYSIPSGGMIPTILPGDRVIATRSTSGALRGQMRIFPFPEQREQLFIKRVIGLPGDQLEFIHGRPIINGWLVPRCHVGPYWTENGTLQLYIEYLGDRVYGTLYERPPEETHCKEDTDCGQGDVCRAEICGALVGPFRVPSGEVWMVGDNRNNSHDSRYWRQGRGAGVPIEELKGTPLILLESKRPDGMLEMARAFEKVDGPPVLTPRLDASIGFAMDKCLRERPAQTTPPGR